MQQFIQPTNHSIVHDSVGGIELLPEPMHKSLINLFRFVYRRDFPAAELAVIKIIEKMLKIGRPDEITKSQNRILLRILYYDFNQKYLDWISYKKKDRRKEVVELDSRERTNYLIAHMQGIADMDDLIYAALSHFYDDDVTREEVEEHIELYKQTFLQE